MVAVLFRAVQAYGAFDIVYVMTGGGPGGSTETVSLYAFQNYFRYLDFGYGSAIAVQGLLLAFVLAALALRAARRTERRMRRAPCGRMIAVAAARRAWSLAPAAWQLADALKPDAQITQVPTAYLPRPATLEHFGALWQRKPFGAYLANSLWISSAGDAPVPGPGRARRGRAGPHERALRATGCCWASCWWPCSRRSCCCSRSTRPCARWAGSTSRWR